MGVAGPGGTPGVIACIFKPFFPLCIFKCNYIGFLDRWALLVMGEAQEEVLARRKRSSPPVPTWARWGWHQNKPTSDLQFVFYLFMGTWAQIPKFKFTCKRGHGLETSHQVVYTVGAVAAAYELYSSVTKATELTKRLQRLKDSSGEERSWNITFSPQIKCVGSSHKLLKVATSS